MLKCVTKLSSIHSGMSKFYFPLTLSVDSIHISKWGGHVFQTTCDTFSSLLLVNNESEMEYPKGKLTVQHETFPRTL